MSDRRISETAKTLINAKALIEDEGNWCRDKIENHKGQMCAWGALNKASFGDAFSLSKAVSTPQYYALESAALELFPEYGSITSVNNHHLGGHAAVMQMFDHAIQAEIAKAASQ